MRGKTELEQCRQLKTGKSYNNNIVIEPVRIVFVFQMGTSYSLSGRQERLWPVTVMVLNSYGFLQNLGENYGYTAD